MDQVITKCSVICRPASSKQNDSRNPCSIHLFSMVIIPYDVIINAYLIYHVKNKSAAKASRFYSILDPHGSTQDVKSATHKRCNTLDLVISKESSSIIVEAHSVCHPYGKHPPKSINIKSPALYISPEIINVKVRRRYIERICHFCNRL